MRTNTINNANIITREIKTTRATLQPITEKIKGGKCCVVGCNCEKAFNRIAVFGQNNGVYLCDYHNNGGKYGYHEKQEYIEHNGTRKTSDNITIGFELESMGRSKDVYAWLCFNNYLPTADCTVDTEYISPVFTSFSGITKQLATIEYFNNNPMFDFSVTNRRCGLHTHYGYKNKPISNNIRANCKVLFQPLCDYIANLSTNKQREFFGRALIDTDYCDSTMTTYSKHTSMFNLQHKYTIEFRLLHFSNAENTVKMMKILRATLELLFKNDGLLSNEEIAQIMVKKFDRELSRF